MAALVRLTHDSANLWIFERLPMVDERVVMNGVTRRVSMVVHHPKPYSPEGPEMVPWAELPVTATIRADVVHEEP